MATPRASGFWETDPRMSRSDSARDYFSADGLEDDQEDGLLEGEDVFDGRTPLDRTIDRIGMGSYQWTLLSLCGLGWMADNMWIQAIAIVLPRVQRHYDVPDAYIGAVSSSMFAGMMLGAVGWGTCSDLMGRITAFNATLFFTAVFGILASLSNSFFTLCVALFFLGSSVGGSMPTDGTLLLEHMPKSKQYLVTALSVFFSVGAVLAAVIGLLVIPQNSCLSGTDIPCDPSKDNLGWKYLLITLALLTLFMFLARMVFFRLHESPRYLVSAGRPQDAVKSLQLISRFNGSEMEVELDDVRDHHHPEEQAALQASLSNSPPLKLSSPPPPQRATSRTVLFDAVGDLENGSGGSSRSGSRGSNEPVYNAVGESQALRSSPTEETPQEPYPSQAHGTTISITEPPEDDSDLVIPPRRPRPPRLRRQSSAASRRSRASVYEQKFFWSLPHAVRKPLWAWWDRVMSVLDPEWRRTTLLVWGAWWSMSLAYTMFNVFLPKLLETGTSLEPKLSSASSKSLEASLWDVVIFTIGGCPGAILGAWLIESRLGRRWSLAGSTVITAFFCLVFALVTSPWAIRASTVGISLSATAMWAVLYGWTPEIFATSVRGSACGIASALSRIGGMIAPILGGILLMMSRTLPVYTSVVVFVLAAFCVVLLNEEPRKPGPGVEKDGGRPLAAH